MATITREEKIARLHAIKPDHIIAAIFSFLPDKFSSDTEKIHTTIKRLRKSGKKEYQELLQDFEFIQGYSFAYSSLLGDVINRLQESRLLAAINPDYTLYEMTPVARKAIQTGIVAKKFSDRVEILKEIALELEKNLSE